MVVKKFIQYGPKLGKQKVKRSMGLARTYKAIQKSKTKRFNKPTVTMIRSPIGSLGGMPIPDRYICKLRYTVRYKFSAGTVVQKSYRGAGAYDPDPSAGGDSPYGFANLAALYGQYICHGSRFRGRFLSTDAGANVATSGRVVVLPVSTDTPPAYASTQACANLPYAKDAIVGPAGASSLKTITNYMTYKRIFGLSGSIENNDNANALTSSTPATDWRWVIVIESADGLTNLQSIIGYLEIDYYLEFFDRKEL